MKCLTGGVQGDFAGKVYAGACLNIHSRHLYAPSCSGIFGPNSVSAACCASFIGAKFS